MFPHSSGAYMKIDICWTMFKWHRTTSLLRLSTRTTYPYHREISGYGTFKLLFRYQFARVTNILAKFAKWNISILLQSKFIIQFGKFVARVLKLRAPMSSHCFNQSNAMHIILTMTFEHGARVTECAFECITDDCKMWKIRIRSEKRAVKEMFSDRSFRVIHSFVRSNNMAYCNKRIACQAFTIAYKLIKSIKRINDRDVLASIPCAISTVICMDIKYHSTLVIRHSS